MVVWALSSINAGVNYDTGYYDVKCYDTKFISGESD